MNDDTVKILYHNPSMPDRGRWAGERGRQFAMALEQQDTEVVAIPPPVASPPGGRRGRVKEWVLSHLPTGWRDRLITLRLFQRGTFDSLRWSWRIVRALRSAPPDVIVARYFEFDWTPLLISKALRRPLILETHSPFGVERTLRTGRSGRLARWMDRRMFRGATRVWVHTDRLRRLVADLIDDSGKITVIPFGVEDQHATRPASKSDRPVNIVFAGSFYPWHGVDELLTAFAQLLDHHAAVHLTLIGRGLTAADAEARADELGITHAVSFPGWLERSDLFDQLARSDIGVAPYLELSFNYFEPVKILDFHMAGLPVVASAVGEIPRMVEDGVTGLLVPPGDPGALAAALAKLVEDPHLRRTMGKAGRAQARHIEDTARAVVGLCRAVAVRP